MLKMPDFSYLASMGLWAQSRISGWYSADVSVSHICCSALSYQPLLAGKVYHPDTPNYEERLSSYWSVSAALRPTCMVLPSTTEDVSVIVRELTRHECPFGIRSGGHGSFAGSNSVEDGVTIDFSHMNTTTYDPETNTVSIQPGTDWGRVYRALEPHGVLVAGGRSATVGVGGFLLGGGLSFHAATRGFSCDDVLGYEVVLADAGVVYATSSSTTTTTSSSSSSDHHPDLFRALCGSSGNLGLVTRFDMRGIIVPPPPSPPSSTVEIYGGVVYYDGAKDGAVAAHLVDAYIRFADDVDNASDDDGNDDDDDNKSSSMMLWWFYVGGDERKMHIAAALEDVAIYEHGVESEKKSSPKRALRLFLQADGIVASTMRYAGLFDITNEFTPGGGVRNIWSTGTYKNDARIMRFATAAHEGLVREIEAVILSSPPGFGTLCHFQPLTRSIVTSGAAGNDHNNNNVLGLEDRLLDGPAMIVLMYVYVDSAEDEARLQPLVRAFQDKLDAYATALGANLGWRYLNYAGAHQDPIASYGPEALGRIRRAAEMYDPDGVFQRLRRSGFKIPP
ncbi:FAD binding domain-containing protein [Xylariomycetidae sp. FL2044]|nr:FAD binding domain-containing protein [Xylariomycetidae sp. FL2044]